MPLSAYHAQLDPLGAVEHKIQVALSALGTLDTDTIPGHAHRVRLNRNDLLQLAGELRGPEVRYRRGWESIDGRLVEAYCTSTTVVIRTSDGWLHERDRLPGTLRYRDQVEAAA
jgi:hypothetical protein